MDRSVKLGIASVILIAGCALPSPFNLIFTVISCLLDFLLPLKAVNGGLSFPSQ